MSDIRDRFKKELKKETLHKVKVDQNLEKLPDDFYANGDRCGNCHAQLDEEDNYCRYCGTKRGEGSFSQFTNRYAVEDCTMYTFTCKSCSHIWQSNRSVVCPKCGTKVTY